MSKFKVVEEIEIDGTKHEVGEELELTKLEVVAEDPASDGQAAGENTGEAAK